MNRFLAALVAVWGASSVHSFVQPSTTAASRSFTASSLASTTATAPPTELSGGITKTVLTPSNNGVPVRKGDIATVQYSGYVVGNEDDDENAPPFCKASRQKMVVGDGSMIPGFESSLLSMSIGERALFRLNTPDMGYGAAGVPPIVPPNAVLEFDVQILDAQPPTANIDFDNLALDATPTTAADIARAYELRQAAKGNVEVEEGWKGWLTKAKNFYFFGLFEGETGERPPWFLRPSITFPLAFAVVGAAFYVTFAGGGITERGAQSTDELDEIILSSNAVATQLAVFAMSMTQVQLGL